MEVENKKVKTPSKKKEPKKQTTAKNKNTKEKSVNAEVKKSTPKKITIAKDVVPEEPKKEVIPIIKNELNEDPNRLREEVKVKKSNFKKEIRSFFILLLIIGLIVGATWYWYNYRYDKNRNKKNENNSTETEVKKDIAYDIKSYKTSTNISLVNNKYIVEYSNKYIYKVLDTNLDVLYEGEQYYSDFYCGRDNNLYIINEDIADYENIIDLYVLEKAEFIKKETLSDQVVQYKPILTNENILLGFIGYYDNTLDDDKQEQELNNYLYLIGHEKKSIGKMLLDEINIINNPRFIITTSSDYLIVSLNDKIGVYDISNNDYLIEPTYSAIIPGLNNEFIVTDEEDLDYIVDDKNQKILDSSYDFITSNFDYYVLGKNKKVSIMNRKHEEVASLEMNYRLHKNENDILDDGGFEVFYAHDINGKIVLEKHSVDVINSSSTKQLLTIYIFDENGKYQTIETDYFSYDKKNKFIYSYNSKNKEVTVYNDSLEVDFDIDLSIYNYKEIPYLTIYNTNLIYTNIGNGLYFNRSTGELQGEKHEITYEDKNFKITYNSKDKQLIVKIGDKEEEYKAYSFDINANLVKKDDGTYLIFYDNLAITIIPNSENTNK